MSGRSFIEKLAGQLVDKFVDVDNFEIREPYKRVVFTTGKTMLHKAKHSKTVEFISKEPSIAVFKKVFLGKKKPLKAEELADESLTHNLYHVLDVEKDADDETIKKAFRVAAMKHHPDRNPGNKANEAVFKTINKAYDVLSDKSRRALYDEFGEISFRMAFDPEVARAGGYGSY